MKGFVLVFAAAVLASKAAMADGGIYVPPGARAETVTECGACHAPLSPQTHRMSDWRGIMANLANHMGEDAELPENIRADIEAYLLANASDGPNTRNEK